ncbi:hypothetical protein ACQPW1_41160 [Nocardia sp. CA-128927]|uniref:hypothetical protein n=1 Tax=Nocardia sp. CA-128927 TaxID=3239975 RepID=UPI003D96CF95
MAESDAAHSCLRGGSLLLAVLDRHRFRTISPFELRGGAAAFMLSASHLTGRLAQGWLLGDARKPLRHIRAT